MYICHIYIFIHIYTDAYLAMHLQGGHNNTEAEQHGRLRAGRNVVSAWCLLKSCRNAHAER